MKTPDEHIDEIEARYIALAKKIVALLEHENATEAEAISVSLIVARTFIETPDPTRPPNPPEIDLALRLIGGIVNGFIHSTVEMRLQAERPRG